jgi:RNA polymerase sigma-70 factor (ECF subfamily)
MLYRVLGHDSEAEDVAQEVIVRALGSAKKFRGDASQLEGWLTKITIYTARDTIRRRRVFRRFFTSTEVDADESPALLATVEQRETVKHTYKALRTMGADDRIAFSLRVIDKMSMLQVAEACGVSLSTAKRRVERARKRFEALAARDPALQDLVEGPRS